MDIFIWMVWIICGVVVLGSLFLLITFIVLLIKNQNTCRNRDLVIDAITNYRVEEVKHGRKPMVDYDDMESYKFTWLRLSDWGYKRILPKEKYKLIKPYIREVF